MLVSVAVLFHCCLAVCVPDGSTVVVLGRSGWTMLAGAAATSMRTEKRSYALVVPFCKCEIDEKQIGARTLV